MVEKMKSYHLPIAISAACLLGTGYSYLDHNSKAGATADSHLMAEATIVEQKTGAEKSRKYYLEVVAKEAIVAKVADVVFDDRGILQRSNFPKLIKADQFFRIGKEVPNTIALSSVGIRNSRTGEYAATGTLEGKKQVLQVFSTKEIQTKINQIVQQGNQ